MWELATSSSALAELILILFILGDLVASIVSFFFALFALHAVVVH